MVKLLTGFNYSLTSRLEFKVTSYSLWLYPEKKITTLNWSSCYENYAYCYRTYYFMVYLICFIFQEIGVKI